MPPRFYPTLGGTKRQEEKAAVRRGHVPIAGLQLAINGTTDLKERLVLKVIYFCALRASEVGLQPVQHVDLKRGTLDILRLKQSEGRTYPLEPWVLEDLRLWMTARPDSPFLFPHPDDASAPLDRWNVYRYWQRAAERAGLDQVTEVVKGKTRQTLMHPHVLKHSIVTHMLERGDDLVFVQEWVGHKSAASTGVYAEVVGKRLVEGQKVMKGLCAELEERKP